MPLLPALFVSPLVALVVAGLPANASAATPGDLFVTNLATNTVDVYARDGTKSVFASGFISPQGLAFDRDHNLYVADSGSGIIYKYDPAGNQTIFYSRLAEPIGLAVDGKVLLVAEHGLNRILTIPLLGGEAKVFATGSESISTVAAAKNVRIYIDGITVHFVSANKSETNGLLDMVAVAAFKSSAFTQIYAFVTSTDGSIYIVHPDYVSSDIHGIKNPVGIAVLPARFPGEGDGVLELYVAEQGTGSILKCREDNSGIKEIFVSNAGLPNFLAFAEYPTPGQPNE